MKAAETALDAAIAKFLEKGVDEGLLNRSRNELVASNVYAIDSQFRLAYMFGAAFAIGQSVENIKTWTDRIRKVTAEQVNEAARKYLRIERSATGVLVPAPSKAASATSN